MIKKQKQGFSLYKRIKSFNYAIRGLKIIFLHEPNFRIHVTAAIIVIIAGMFFKIKTSEWIMVVMVIGLVFITESINTAIERIVDFVSPQHHMEAGRIKDIAAAAVLLSAITAVIIGLIIFLPRFIIFLK